MELKIGTNKSNSKEFIKLSDTQKKFNTAFIGCSKEQKTDVLYPILAKNAAASTGINTSDACGSTFIVDNIDDSYFIFAVVKRMMKAKKAVLIKPSNDANIYHEIINDEPYDYDKFNRLINYNMHVKNKSILIVDAEEYKYGELSRRFISKLLLHIWLSIQNEKATLGRSNILYVDGAEKYLDVMENILKYGNHFNLSTMLLIKDRHNLSIKNKMLLDTAVENKFLFNSLTKEDNDFYNVLNDESLETKNYFISKIKNAENYTYAVTEGILITEFKESEINSLKDSAKKIKREDVVSDNGVPKAKQINDFNLMLYGNKQNSESNSIISTTNKTKKIETTKINADDYKDVIVATILKAKEPYNGEIFHLALTDAQKKHINHVTEQKQENKKEAEVIKKEKIEDDNDKTIEGQKIEHSNNKNEKKENLPEKEKQDEPAKVVKEEETKTKLADEDADEDIKITIERPTEVNPFDEALENSLEGIIDRNISEADNGIIEDEPLIMDEDEDLKEIQEELNPNEQEDSKVELEQVKTMKLERAPEQVAPGATIIDINDLLMDDDE